MMMNNKPRSINFHLTEKCNMHCEYCFAKYSKDGSCSQLLSLSQYFRIIDKIFKEGFSKISFAGGEPLLHPFLFELIRYAKKQNLTTMLVTNGALLTPGFLKKSSLFLDWVSISVDSLSQKVNAEIGRVYQGVGMTAELYRQKVKLIKKAGIRLKINTVVSSLNYNESFVQFVSDVSPERWKIFQVLPIENANKEKVGRFLINENKFNDFLQENSDVRCLIVPESNSDMIDSYIMIDPQGRLYSNSQNVLTYSKPLYKFSLRMALQDGGFVLEKYLQRGGEYVWG